MNFSGNYTYHVSSSHAGVSITTDLELKQEGNIVKGKIFSAGNFYYEPNPTDGFSYELAGTIDPSQPEKVTLQSEIGDVLAWFEAGKLFVKFLGAPQVYNKL
jgi:hypothetical protein